MAIVRPTVGGYVADPRAAADEAKWNKIHANTGRLAAMIPQAMLRQYAIDESLRAAEERASAKEARAKGEAAYQSLISDPFLNTASYEGGPRTTNTQAQLSEMIAQGAGGTPMVTVPGVEPGTTRTMPAEERLAKMLRYEAIAAGDTPVDRENIARANAEVEAVRQMMGSAPVAPNIPAGTPVVRPQVERAPASPLEGSPLEGYRGPQTTATTVAMPEAQAAEFVRAQVMADPGLRAAIENDEMVATFWMSATNAERMALIEEIKKKTAEARMFGESPSRAAR